MNSMGLKGVCGQFHWVYLFPIHFHFATHGSEPSSLGKKKVKCGIDDDNGSDDDKCLETGEGASCPIKVLITRPT